MENCPKCGHKVPAPWHGMEPVPSCPYCGLRFETGEQGPVVPVVSEEETPRLGEKLPTTAQTLFYLNFRAAFWCQAVAGGLALVHLSLNLGEWIAEYGPDPVQGSPLACTVYLLAFQFILWFGRFRERNHREFAFYMALGALGCLVMTGLFSVLDPRPRFGVPLSLFVVVFAYTGLSNLVFSLFGNRFH